MALGFTRGLPARAVVYDCMDELSLFRGAPSELLEREAELLRIAHLVFTGGRSLYEAKRSRHAGVHLFPSSIDAGHFGKARGGMEAPDDQAALPRPRLGYCGVIDERMDLDLLAGIAAARPEWQLVMIGPVVKIDSADLPKHPNIHYLGAREYGELPRYIAGWDVALLPFAHNASTRFISPTKTPEYLAAGKPVVSTSIRDVVIPYGVEGLVRIADRVADFVEAVEGALAQDTRTSGWLERVDHFLADMSWDRTQRDMAARIAGVLERSRAARSAAVADPSSRTRQPDALAAG
jgi:UDP-galactopyranose mutase